MLSLITLPNATTTLSLASEWGNAFFSEWWGIMLAGVGIIIAGMALVWLIRLFSQGIDRLFHHDDDVSVYVNKTLEDYKRINKM